MKFLLFIVLLFTGAGAFAQAPALMRYGTLDSTTYLSVVTAALTYAPITSTQLSTATGSTLTVNNASTWVIINPSTTIAALTITMPATPYDTQFIDVTFGGSITSGVVVTAISVIANTGQTLLQPYVLDIVQAGETLSYQYNLSQKIWYRL